MQSDHQNESFSNSNRQEEERKEEVLAEEQPPRSNFAIQVVNIPPEEEAEENKGSNSSQMGDCDELVISPSFPRFKENKGLPPRGKININPKERELILAAIKQNRPNSFFELASSLNLPQKPSQYQHHRVKPKEAEFYLKPIEDFLKNLSNPDYLLEQSKLQLEIAKLNNQGLPDEPEEEQSHLPV